MYELLILALLMRDSMHGYLIAKIMNDMIGPETKVSHGSLYPKLKALEKVGIITDSPVLDETTHHERQARAYTISEEGRARFHQLMMDMTTHPGEYSKFFWLKVCFFDFLHPVERLELVDHYIHYCQMHIHHMKTEAKNVVEGKGYYHSLSLAQLELTLHASRRAASHWQVEMDYATSLREKEMAKALADSINTAGRQ
ncbi:MAG TPA: PadR family transcriptional regulator [Ktedonobacteraceae bacterium]|nr:PadR family transcriptional regulator [Ktedonobacteraceae bacterium]